MTRTVRITQRHHKARVSHRCDDCGDVITPGTVYIRTLWLLDGSFYSQATHTTYNGCDRD